MTLWHAINPRITDEVIPEALEPITSRGTTRGARTGVDVDVYSRNVLMCCVFGYKTGQDRTGEGMRASISISDMYSQVRSKGIGPNQERRKSSAHFLL